MTRSAWTSVLLTVTLLVTLSWAGPWFREGASPVPPATPPEASEVPGPSLAERAATVRTTLSGWGREMGAALDSRARGTALIVFAGALTLIALGSGLAMIRRRQNDRRPTPATNLGRWTSRTGLARDAARFLIHRQHRKPLPLPGPETIAPEHSRHG